jgi:hypothetical protein
MKIVMMEADANLIADGFDLVVRDCIAAADDCDID